MLTNPDFKELLSTFRDCNVRFLVVGGYAVMRYAVGERRNEQGIRLALGALPGDLSRLVVTDALRLLAVSLVIGLGLAVLAG